MLLASLSGALLARSRPGLSTEAVLLRPLEGAPLPVKELWRHGRTSKRAMQTTLNAAVRHGLVALDGGTARLLVPLPPVEPASCPPLEALVSKLELEHPHFPVPYGTADPTFTGGPGVDWKPITREHPAGGDLPMTALLAQALVAFAIDYERARRGPIQWAANILDGLGDDGVDLSALPARGTHSVANLARLGVVAVDPDRTVRLTAVGRAMRDAYVPLCQEVERGWRHRLGSSLVDEVVDAVRVDGRSRPFPLVAWTGSEWSLLP